MLQRLNGSRPLCHDSGRASPTANRNALNYDSSVGGKADKVCDIAEKLTLRSSVMGDLMGGAGLLHHPRKFCCQVASRVSLEVIVKVGDGINLIHAQCLGQEYMTREGLLTTATTATATIGPTRGFSFLFLFGAIFVRVEVQNAM